MNDLRYTLCEELEKVARKKDIGAGDLELAHKLTDTIKNIDKISCLEADGEYGHGSSYANRGKHYVRGHYSREGARRDSRGRYSRDDGRMEMMEHLEMALDAANDEEREVIHRMMLKLEEN